MSPAPEWLAVTGSNITRRYWGSTYVRADLISAQTHLSVAGHEKMASIARTARRGIERSGTSRLSELGHAKLDVEPTACSARGPEPSGPKAHPDRRPVRSGPAGDVA